MKQSQLNLIKWKLNKDGNISRNWCLSRNITRLGSYICQLKYEDYDFIRRYTKNRKNYEYVWMNRSNNR